MVITHRESFLKKHNLPPDTHLSLQQMSRLSGVPVRALKEIFLRAEGAWSSNIKSVRLKKDFSKNPDLSKYPRASRLSKEQWAYARVYSFLDKGKTFYTADSDIAKEYNLV